MMPHLLLTQNSAIAGKRIKRARRIAYEMDGMKAQSDCSKRIWIRAGLKDDINRYGYKNSIGIDAENVFFIRRFVVTPANI